MFFYQSKKQKIMVVVYNLLKKGDISPLNPEEEKDQVLIKKLFNYCLKHNWLDEAGNTSLKIEDEKERDFCLRLVVNAYINLDYLDDAKEFIEKMSQDAQKEFKWLKEIN